MAGLMFHKYDGAGNDFVLIDAREANVVGSLSPTWIARLLDRNRGVGADGLLVVRKPSSPDLLVEVQYWNSDGYPAEYCGNGARCVAAFLSVETDLLPTEEAPLLRYQLGDVIVEAKASGGGRFAVGHPLPTRLEPPPNPIPLPAEVLGSWYGAGVPHWVFPIEELGQFDLETWGALVRHRPEFGPDGTNVDAVELLASTVYVRTFERGVEAETQACGSGLLASAWWAHQERDLPWPIRLQSQSGERFVTWREEDRLWLEGPARAVFSGHLSEGVLEDDVLEDEIRN